VPGPHTNPSRGRRQGPSRTHLPIIASLPARRLRGVTYFDIGFVLHLSPRDVAPDLRIPSPHPPILSRGRFSRNRLRFACPPPFLAPRTHKLALFCMIRPRLGRHLRQQIGCRRPRGQEEAARYVNKSGRLALFGAPCCTSGPLRATTRISRCAGRDDVGAPWHRSGEPGDWRRRLTYRRDPYGLSIVVIQTSYTGRMGCQAKNNRALGRPRRQVRSRQVFFHFPLFSCGTDGARLLYL
jgi:hypothetical protein